MCSRQVDEATGQIILSVTWRGNFSHLPPSYYGDTLDSTRLSVFSGTVNSTSRDPGIERRGVLATFSNGLGKQQRTHVLRGDSGNIALSLLEVRANGSGVIYVLGLPPFIAGDYDHYLLVVSSSYLYQAIFTSKLQCIDYVLALRCVIQWNLLY